MSVRRYLIWVQAVFLLSGALFGSGVAAVAADSRPSLRVQIAPPKIPEDRKQEWSMVLIGFGIHNMISQEFHNTGRFRMLEEKPQILKLMDGSAYKGGAPDWDVKGGVTSSTFEGGGRFFGCRNKISITVTITATSSQGKTITATAKGYATQKQNSEDCKWKKEVLIDPFSVLPATQMAVSEAVESIVRQMQLPQATVVSTQGNAGGVGLPKKTRSLWCSRLKSIRACSMSTPYYENGQCTTRLKSGCSRWCKRPDTSTKKKSPKS